MHKYSINEISDNKQINLNEQDNDHNDNYKLKSIN